jgi:hypothetical protein
MVTINNMKIKITIMIIQTLLNLVFISSCSSQKEFVKITEFATSTKFSSQADLFFTRIIQNDDLNSGITLEQSFPEQIQKNNHITFIVLNHTNETVIFPDQGFGFELYGYNQNNLIWEKQTLRLRSDQTIKELPGKVEFMDFKNNNIWTILNNELSDIPYDVVRLYVSGKGAKSGKIYGTYLDINIR